MKTEKFIEALWRRIVGKPFSARILVDVLRFDGGADIDGLSDSELVSLIEGKFLEISDWSGVRFAFSEILAFYSILEKIEREHVVACAFTMIIVAECVRKDLTDWDQHIFLVIDCLIRCKKSLEREEMTFLFEKMFGGATPQP